jgi:plasmid stabilization system protein ParE
MKPIEIKQGAERDLREAISFYRKKDRDLPARFLTAFNDIVEHIEANPEIGIAVAKAARSVKIKRFPFRVVFRDEPTAIMIFAVAHDRRRPGYWWRRVPRSN